MVSGESHQDVYITDDALDIAQQNQIKGIPGLRSNPNGYSYSHNIEVDNRSHQDLKVYGIDENGLSYFIRDASSRSSPSIPGSRYGQVFTLQDSENRVVGIYVYTHKNQTFYINDDIIEDIGY